MRLRRGNPLLKAVLILTSIIAAVVLLAPVLAVATGGRRLRFFIEPQFANTMEKMRRADAVRAFTLPKDPSITPSQAGAALNTLQPAGTVTSRFVRKTSSPAAASPWPYAGLAPELFPTAHSPASGGGPSSQKILALALAGLKPDELAFLEHVAHAPVWREVEIIGRAQSIDIIGERFVLPFPDDAHLFEMPIMKFGATKDLAYAGVSRAAYYLARAQKDSAEHALRVVTSLGFALSDNGTLLIDQLIGAVIVGIGRDALLEFYALTKNPSSQVLQARLDSAAAGQTSPKVVAERRPATRTREQLIALVNDPTMPRGLRFETLSQLALLPCTNVRDLFAGPGSDVELVFARARKELARFPSEVAQVDLASRMLDHPLQRSSEGAGPGFALWAGSVASAIFRNPRLESCPSYVLM